MKTLVDKIWDDHAIVTRDDGATLLWVDRHYVHEGSHHGFRALTARGARVAEPGLTVAVADHYVPVRERGAAIADPAIARMVATLTDNAATHGLRHFGLDTPHWPCRRAAVGGDRHRPADPGALHVGAAVGGLWRISLA